MSAMKIDKKARDGSLRFVLPRSIGDVEFGVKAPPRLVRAVVDRLGALPSAAEFR
jgi:3-dehydroquinate synthetase